MLRGVPDLRPKQTRHRRLSVVFVGALLVVGIALTMIRVCADGGAMAGAYRTCECRGFEWQVYDQTAADGPRRTVCLGWIRSWTCYQFRTGPRVACSGL
jgi:hypothetical protein